MKDFLRQSLINSFSLYIVASIFPGLTVPQQLLNLIWAGIIFTLINRLVKPVIKLFLLPINLITLGLFGW
ncbi:phage holin family protein, partial [Microgenomates group bacterium]|nr:phage holin family protein [Microgenomates group bacterium]